MFMNIKICVYEHKNLCLLSLCLYKRSVYFQFSSWLFSNTWMAKAWACTSDGIRSETMIFFQKILITKKIQKKYTKIAFLLFSTLPKILWKITLTFLQLSKFQEKKQKYKLHRFAVQMVFKIQFFKCFFCNFEDCKNVNVLVDWIFTNVIFDWNFHKFSDFG